VDGGLAPPHETVAGLIPGFAAYLLLFLLPGGWQWGSIEGLDDVVGHFLRRDFGTFQLALGYEGVAFWEHPWLYVKRLPIELTLFLIPAALGLRELRGDRRGFFGAVLASWILAGPVFLGLFDVPTVGEGASMAKRFHIPSLVLLTPFIAAGVIRISERFRAAPLAWALIAGLLAYPKAERGPGPCSRTTRSTACPASTRTPSSSARATTSSGASPTPRTCSGTGRTWSSSAPG